MPFSDPEKRKAYTQTPEYKAKQKAWRDRPENKEKAKAYREDPDGIKSKRISHWKGRGVICDDWDVLYERYLNTEFCEDCKCKLTEDRYNTKTTRCLDHDHNTGLFRNVVCNSCNIKRG